jgi:hypothetical protein
MAFGPGVFGSTAFGLSFQPTRQAKACTPNKISRSPKPNAIALNGTCECEQYIGQLQKRFLRVAVSEFKLNHCPTFNACNADG